MLWFIGLGIRGTGGLSLDAKEVLTACDTVYAEAFTSPVHDDEIKKLERVLGKTVIPARRWFVEDGREILRAADVGQVALLTYGDPFIATTHSELRTRALKQQVTVRVLYSASGITALIGETGLHFYKFARASTIMSDPMSAVSVYNVLYSNLLSGSHTLILTECRQPDSVTEGYFFLDPSKALNALAAVEEDNHYGAFTEETFAILTSRIGLPDQSIVAGKVKELSGIEFGRGPHSIIIPGSFHFTESDALQVLAHCFSEPFDNAQSVSRIASGMIKKYIPKAREAVRSLRGLSLKGGTESLIGAGDLTVLDNAEYYLQDAEKFGREGRFELAVLSVGYAEGLIDALRFQKGLNPWNSD